MSVLIETDDLAKSFRGLKAVDGLSFRVPAGEVYGFLGQNGAGKSTTIRMLLTLIEPSAGSIRFFGKELKQHRREILRQVGAIIEKPDLYKYLSAYENLRIMAQLSGLRPSKDQLMRELDRVGLAGRAHDKVKTFSQGMKQRLGIACALIHDPRLIILDEPTNGLDPQGIADMRNLILRLAREEGKTVFVSSHLLSEVEVIADSMLIIDRGRKVAEGKVSELLHPSDTLVRLETGDDQAARRLLGTTAWGALLVSGEELTVRMHRDEVPALTRYLVEQGVALRSVHPQHSLEAYFLSRTTANQHVAAYPHRTL
jgi:ABC-type multidrug transport system ATPase subunit